jgi:hypothetical protein
MAGRSKTIVEEEFAAKVTFQVFEMVIKVTGL